MVIMDWIGLSQSASGLGWIGFSKMDPCPTLRQTDGQTPHDGIGCAYAYHRAASSDFDEILYTAADFELHKRHVIKNEKSCMGQTPSSTKRIYYSSSRPQKAHHCVNPRLLSYQL